MRLNWRTLASALEVSALQIETLGSPSLGNLRSRAAFDCSEGWKKLFVCTAEVAKIWTQKLSLVFHRMAVPLFR